MSISKMSNQELESQLLHFVNQERKLLHVILIHIREVDNRKLYLEKARSSLFEYLVKDLGYSAAAAQRRVEASRLLKTIPDLAEKIQTGSVNLSQIGELHRAIKQKEKESTKVISNEIKSDLLFKIENKSTFETQKILAKELDIQLKPLETKQVQKDESVHLHITLSKEQYAMLLDCQNLAGHVLLQQNDTSISGVLDILMNTYIDNKKSNHSGKKESLSTQASVSASEVKMNAPKKHSAKSESTAYATKKVHTNKTLTPKTRKIILTKYPCCQYNS